MRHPHPHPHHPRTHPRPHQDIKCVINFDCPSSGERVDRIAAWTAGCAGSSCTLLADDARVAAEIVRVLRGSDQQVPDS